MVKQSPRTKTKATSRTESVVVVSKIQKFLPWLLVVGSIIGLLAATVLMVEKVHLLKHPEATLTCDLNPVVACGSVINTPQASAFGFPNPIIGLIGFGIVLTIGMALLAGARFKRWFWIGLQLGTLFGVVFVTWLQYQSIYSIGALCPYCMVVWAVTIPIFVYTTVHNLREGYLRLPATLSGVGRFVQKYHVELLVTWFLLIFLAIVEHFWYYWSTLL